MPPADWPARGELVVAGLTVRFVAHKPPVLRGLDLHVRPGEKLVVAGRTGAGKSTLIAALFRLVEPERGRIVLDGIDVAAVQPGELRRRLGYIPQDPFLLSGTLRSALDPLGCCSTAALAEALGRVQLFEGLDEERAAAALELVVEPGGRNFSVGERQLICLARLLLSRHRVIVLDEPTANLDAATERKLRSVVATELADATVIVVSHRSAPFLDGPRVVRIQDGVAVEQAPVEANR